MEEQEATLSLIAEQLRRWLVPVDPSPAFVCSLKRELIEAAYRQQERARTLRRILLVSAAIFGSVASVAGVAAVLVLRRRARAHPPVVAG
ncbi:MAG: hypothetical protein RML46_09880 [Anaerolineae bacterium]|nr:hypothetical protein [Anaerolineae bacterium]MDW8069212.1 hypothetical protein [Anaerolineae bacterium]